MNLHKKHYFVIACWLIINLVQSAFTGLHSDESYYWMFSENLDWGYFDHPPMVALLIHLGHLIIPGELGVRLVLVILSTGTLALILNELNEQKDLFFISVFILSFPLIHTHIAGFLAIPDIPLLFFTLLFLMLYKKFLQHPTVGLSVLLALVTAGMIYSKYHAFLVIGFTVLSNLKLLRKATFWMAVILTALLLLPHFWWQLENDFPTFHYHLIERVKPFRLKYVFPNLINQLIMAGPLTGVLIFWKLGKFRIKNDYDRALVFNIIGFYLLFFFMSFKNRIEAHWSAAIIPMLMIATYSLISNDPKIKMWFKRLAVPVIALLLLFRIYLALDIIPNVGHAKITFYNRKAHALEIKNMADDRKVGFFNNYAAISNYIFYTGDSAVHLSTPTYRFCQYDLWNEEDFAEGDLLFAQQPKHLNPPHMTRMVTGQMKGFVVIEKFQSLKDLRISLRNALFEKQILTFELELSNHNDHPVYTDHVSKPSVCIMQNETEIVSVPLTQSTEPIKIEPGEKATILLTCPGGKIDRKAGIALYTRSREKIRGEIISLFFDPSESKWFVR